MRLWKETVALLLILTVAITISSGQGKSKQMEAGDPELAKKIRRFAPTELTADTSRLSANDRKALNKIIEAAKLLDPLFLRQVWSGNEALRQKLAADQSDLGRQRLHYFMINKGPWSRIDSNEPFIVGVPSKPPHAKFYPEDITREEFNSLGGRAITGRETESHRLFLSDPARR